MADSPYEKGLTELAKMKVADLKAELKQRGLAITGNKNELIERLQLAIQDSTLGLDEANEEVLDEDAVLADEEIEEEVAAKPTPVKPILKRKSTVAANGTATPAANTPAKKVLINRKVEAQATPKSAAVITPAAAKATANANNVAAKKVVTVAAPAEKKKQQPVEAKPQQQQQQQQSEQQQQQQQPEMNGKKVVKVTELTDKERVERLEARAKKFGIPLSEASKKEARAARFNITPTTPKSSGNAYSIKSSLVETSYEQLKKRGERFGTNVSTLLAKAEIEDKKEKRKARFSEIKPVEKVTVATVKLVK